MNDIQTLKPVLIVVLVAMLLVQFVGIIKNGKDLGVPIPITIYGIVVLSIVFSVLFHKFLVAARDGGMLSVFGIYP